MRIRDRLWQSALIAWLALASGILEAKSPPERISLKSAINPPIPRLVAWADEPQKATSGEESRPTPASEKDTETKSAAPNSTGAKSANSKSGETKTNDAKTKKQLKKAPTTKQDPAKPAEETSDKPPAPAPDGIPGDEPESDTTEPAQQDSKTIDNDAKEWATKASQSADAAQRSATNAAQAADAAKRYADAAQALLAASQNQVDAAKYYADAARSVSSAAPASRSGTILHRINRIQRPRTASAGSSSLYPTRTSPVVAAQTVHTLFCALTDDPNIGDGIRINQRFLANLFDTQFKNCKSRLDSRPNLIDPNFTRAGVINAIDSIPVGPTDTLFCYISTHGGFDRQKGHLFATSDSQQTPGILRSEVMQHLRAKKPRLIVLISDSCANIVTAPMYLTAPAGNPPPAYHPLFDLLLHFQGEMSVNAAQPGLETQYFLTGPGVITMTGGGLFTRALCDRAIFANVNRWEDFLLAVNSQLLVEARKTNDPSSQSAPCVFDATGAPFDLSGRQLPIP